MNGKKLRIYMDNCCYNRPFDDQSQLIINIESVAKLFIQSQVLIGKHELIWSDILDYENSKNPFEERYKRIIKKADHINEVAIVNSIDFVKEMENENEN